MNVIALRGGYDLDSLLGSIASYGNMDPSAPFQGYDVNYDASSYEMQTNNSQSVSFGQYSFNGWTGSDYFANSISLGSKYGSLNFSESGFSQYSGYDSQTPWGESYGGHSEASTVSILSASFVSPEPTPPIYHSNESVPMPQFLGAGRADNFVFAIDVRSTSNDYSGFNGADGSSQYASHTHIDDQLLAVQFGQNGFQVAQMHQVSDFTTSTSHSPWGVDTIDTHSSIVTDTHIIGTEHHFLLG